MRKILGKIAESALLCLLGGCAFTGIRREPAPLPTFQYENARLRSVAWQIPTNVDPTDCLEMAMVTDVGVLGGRDFNGTFPLRRIVMREFQRLIDANMHQPRSGEKPLVTIKIYSKRILVEQRGRRSHAEMAFDIQLIDPIDLGKRPYYRGSFQTEWNGFHGDDEAVPETVYQAVGRVVAQLVEGIVKDSSAMDALAGIIPPPPVHVVPPSLGDIKFDSVRDGGIALGRCTVKCNGYEGFAADEWARNRIRNLCQTKLGIEAERLRVVYSSEKFDEKKKTWSYVFRAFPRAQVVLDYDPHTRTGVCIGDLGLLDQRIDIASRYLEKFVLEEMQRRGGLVSTVRGNAKVRIRYGEVKTDLANNLLSLSFSLPY